jgi:hypothetical protein
MALEGCKKKLVWVSFKQYFFFNHIRLIKIKTQQRILRIVISIKQEKSAVVFILQKKKKESPIYN